MPADDLSPFQVLEWLKKNKHAEEIEYVHSVYKGTLKKRDGSSVNGVLTIYQTILGSDPRPHYRIFAETAENKSATGNLEGSIQDALAGIHWEKLD